MIKLFSGDKCFKSKVTSKVIYGAEYKYLSSIIGEENAREFVIPYPEPSVVELLRNCGKYVAIWRYADIHKCTLSKATEQVDLIEADMKYLKGGDFYERVF